MVATAQGISFIVQCQVQLQDSFAAPCITRFQDCMPDPAILICTLPCFSNLYQPPGQLNALSCLKCFLSVWGMTPLIHRLVLLPSALALFGGWVHVVEAGKSDAIKIDNR